jgi:hypothetical protein
MNVATFKTHVPLALLCMEALLEVTKSLSVLSSHYFEECIPVQRFVVSRTKSHMKPKPAQK